MDATPPIFEATLSTGRRALSRLQELGAVVLLGWSLWRLYGAVQAGDVALLWLGLQIFATMLIAAFLLLHLWGLTRPNVPEIMRIDAEGVHLPQRVGGGVTQMTVPWDSVASVELNRAGGRLMRSYLNHGPAGAHRSAVLPFARLDDAQAQAALVVLLHYRPDAEAPWSEQLQNHASTPPAEM